MLTTVRGHKTWPCSFWRRTLWTLVLQEPWRIPVDNPNWFASTSGRAAIFCGTSAISRRIRAATSSDDWVAIRFGDIYIISCYISPNDDINRFKNSMEEIKGFIGDKNRVLLCGDFNARLTIWGCRSGNRRGLLLSEWVSDVDFCVMNSGNEPTCVRPQGSSVVDLSIASPWIAERINEWSVRCNDETLSDHRYIVLSVGIGTSPWGHNKYPRWKMGNFDREMFREILN